MLFHSILIYGTHWVFCISYVFWLVFRSKNIFSVGIYLFKLMNFVNKFYSFLSLLYINIYCFYKWRALRCAFLKEVRFVSLLILLPCLFFVLYIIDFYVLLAMATNGPFFSGRLQHELEKKLTTQFEYKHDTWSIEIESQQIMVFWSLFFLLLSN